MPAPRKRSLLFAAAAVPLAAVLLALLLWPHAPRVGPVGPDWTPQKLRDELERVGVVYEGREMAAAPGVNPGYYLKRPGDRRTWEELAAHGRIAPHTMRGYLAVTVLPRGFRSLTDEEGRVSLLHFMLYGDPAEIRRVLEAVAR